VARLGEGRPGPRRGQHGLTFKPPSPWWDAEIKSATSDALTSPAWDLSGANLTWALLGGWTVARRPSIVYYRADLSGATLSGGTLRLADLAHADLRDARLPEYMPVPAGWKLDLGSGRLNRADTGSGPAEAK